MTCTTMCILFCTVVTNVLSSIFIYTLHTVYYDLIFHLIYFVSFSLTKVSQANLIIISMFYGKV